MEVKNYSGVIDANMNKYIDLNRLGPKWPFRMLVLGGSGCGKTNMVVDLLLNHLYYDKIFVYAKDLMEPYYLFLEKVFKKGLDSGVLKEYHMSEELDDMIDLERLDADKKMQTLVVFDDFITEKDQKMVEDLFVRGRKKNVSTIYIAQSYFCVPKIVRLNCNYIAIYELADNDEVRRVCKKYCKGFNIDDFVPIFHECTKDRHDFMLIDMRTNVRELKYRKNWCEVLI